MKHLLLFAVLVVNLTFSIAQNNIGIGTQTPHASAQLDISSTTKGLLAPRMTTAQRNGIAAPAKGLLVYDTQENSLFHYNGSTWVNLSSVGGGGFTLPYTASVNLSNNPFQITNAGNGSAITGITTNEFGYGVSGISNSAYGYGVYGYANSANAIAVYGNAGLGTAVKAYSIGGLGIDARSTNQSAIKASILLGANPYPVIEATHAGAGTALYGKSTTGYGLEVEGNLKISGGNTNPTEGAVLMSDATGNATWKALPSGFTLISSNWIFAMDSPSRDTTIDGTLMKVYYISAPELTENLISTANINVYFRTGDLGPFQLPYISNGGGRANALQAFFKVGKIGITRPTFNETTPKNINLPNSLLFRYTIMQ